MITDLWNFQRIIDVDAFSRRTDERMDGWMDERTSRPADRRNRRLSYVLTYASEYLIKILITTASNGVSPSTDSHDAVYKIVNIIIYISVTRDR